MQIHTDFSCGLISSGRRSDLRTFRIPQFAPHQPQIASFECFCFLVLSPARGGGLQPAIRADAVNGMHPGHLNWLVPSFADRAGQRRLLGFFSRMPAWPDRCGVHWAVSVSRRGARGNRRTVRAVHRENPENSIMIFPADTANARTSTLIARWDLRSPRLPDTTVAGMGDTLCGSR